MYLSKLNLSEQEAELMRGLAVTSVVVAILLLTPFAIQSTFAKGQLPRTGIGAVFLQDDLGERLPISHSEYRQASLGQNITIATVFVNHLDAKVAYVLIVEARNEDGITTFLKLHESIEAPMGNRSIETDTLKFAWQPDEKGKYEVRAFAVSNFTKPEMLSVVKTNKIEIA